MRVLYDAQLIQPPETGGEKVSGNDTRGHTVSQWFIWNGRAPGFTQTCEERATVWGPQGVPIVRQYQRSGWLSRIVWNAAPYTHTLEEFLDNDDLFFQFWHVLRVPLDCLSLTWRYVKHRVLGNVVWDVEGHRHEAKLRAANKWSHPVHTVTVPLFWKLVSALWTPAQWAIGRLSNPVA